MSQQHGAIENSSLSKPSAYPTNWRIEHSDGTVKQQKAQTAFEACRLLGWSMGECVRFDQVPGEL